MPFVDGMDYQEQQHFTVKQLQAIVPLNVCHDLCLWAYTNADPGPEDLPMVVQALTLEYDKKAICQTIGETGMNTPRQAI